MTRLLFTSAIAVAIVVACVLCGCSGGGANGGNPPPPGDTATVRGTVVQADNVNVGLGGATVQALGFGVAGVGAAQNSVVAQTTADASGNFVLDDIPIGVVTIMADTTNEANYGAQSIPGLQLNKNDDLQLTITVLPVTTAPPTIISLTPNRAMIDLFGQVKFNGSVTSSTGLLAATPSYFLTGGIGIVDKNGQFTATQTGNGQVIAVSGSARATANIEVTGPRDPQITTFLVAPLTLSATGGTTTITVAANDGDGITQVSAEIFQPGGDVLNAVLERVQDTQETFRLEQDLPANSNPPDAGGHQADQRYSIRVTATDGSGASTTSDFVDVTVVGIDSPPPPI